MLHEKHECRTNDQPVKDCPFPHTTRHYIPVKDEHGKEATLAVGESVFRKLAEKLKELEPKTLLLPLDTYSVRVSMSEGYVHAPYIPDIVRERAKDIAFCSDTVLRIVKARNRAGEKMSFQVLKNKIPSGFSNPCAEIELPIGKQLKAVVAPAGDGVSILEKTIGDAINESAKRILTPGYIADPKAYPHRCPRCSAPAYVGLQMVDCSRKSCT